MREIDTEIPVVWPAWCYSGEAVTDSPQTASSPHQTAQSPQLNLNKNRGKRKSSSNHQNQISNQNQSPVTTQLPIDKMLSERIMTDIKKNFTINFLNNDKMKSSSENSGYEYNSSNNSNSGCMKTISNGDLTVNNNNNIKSERLSPINNDVQSTASRSRSITPSSFSGTPPQTIHSHDMLTASAPNSILPPMPNTNRPEFQARNYSDFMRSLAAKYNNGNNNDSPPTKNSFLEPRATFNSAKSTKENLLNSLEHKKTSPLLPQVPNPNIISSLFSGLPFPSGVFPPLIDMSSTQALVSLAKAAKEAELQTLLKGTPNKKLNSSSLNFLTQFPASALPAFPSNYPTPTSSHSPFSLANFQSSSTSSVAAALAATTTPSTKNSARPDNSGHPLDLSSAPLPKKIKLSSNHQIGDTSPRAPTTSPPVGSSTSTSSNQSCSSLPTNCQQQQPHQMSQNNQHQQQQHVVQRKCQAQSEEINSWNVDQVCDFIGSIDICVEYVQNFRDQSIDGTGLPQLTEEHLTNSLGLKLGPALKLKSVLAKKLGGPCPCVSCSTAIKFETVSSAPTLATSTTTNSLSRPTSTDSAS